MSECYNNTSLILLMGVSGSGKTTLAKKLHEKSSSGIMLSADDYFMKSGQYVFDKTKQKDAHANCIRNLISYTTYIIGQTNQDQPCNIIIHNTNTTLIACSPYIAIGQAYGLNVYPVHLNIPFSTCVQRQTHNVDLEVMQKMHSQLQISIDEWPSFWPEIITIDEETSFDVLCQKLNIL